MSKCKRLHLSAYSFENISGGAYPPGSRRKARGLRPLGTSPPNDKSWIKPWRRIFDGHTHNCFLKERKAKTAGYMIISTLIVTATITLFKHNNTYTFFFWAKQGFPSLPLLSRQIKHANTREKSLRHVAKVAKFLDDNKPKTSLKKWITTSME